MFAQFIKLPLLRTMTTTIKGYTREYKSCISVSVSNELLFEWCPNMNGLFMMVREGEYVKSPYSNENQELVIENLFSPTSLVSFKSWLETGKYHVTFAKEREDAVVLANYFGIDEISIDDTTPKDSNELVDEVDDDERDNLDEECEYAEDEEYLEFQRGRDKLDVFGDFDGFGHEDSDLPWD